MSDKDVNVHQINSGFRQSKKLTRIERLEKAVKQLASLPQFLLQRFQDLTKVVEDLRFTYEIVGIILKEKGIITQEEVNEVGKRLVEERRKQRVENMKTVQEEAKKRTEAAQSDGREKLEGGIDGTIAETLDSDEIIKTLKETGVDEDSRSEVARDLMQSNEELRQQQVQDTDVSIKRIP